MLVTGYDFTQLYRSNVTAISVRLLIIVFFLSFIAISSASAQVAHYSDSWASGDDGEGSNPIVIVGSGVSDDSYTSDGHTYSINVKLTSPNGRVAEALPSDYTMWYARTDIVLPWEENDIGDYNTQSIHWSHCPSDVDGFNFVSGVSSFWFPVAAFRQCYEYRGFIPAQGEHWYSVDCIGPCTATYPRNRFFTTNRGNHYVCTGVRFNVLGSWLCIGRCRGSSLHEGCF